MFISVVLQVCNNEFLCYKLLSQLIKSIIQNKDSLIGEKGVDSSYRWMLVFPPHVDVGVCVEHLEIRLGVKGWVTGK